MKDELYERELGWMELVARAFSIFFQNIGGVLVVMAVVFLPISLLESVIEMRMAAVNSFLSTVQVAGTFLENEAGIMEAFRQTVVGSLLEMAILLFLAPVGTITIAKLTKQTVDGKEPDVKTALKEALALEPKIIVVGLVYGVAVTLASVLLIPGIWLSILWELYLYCIGLGGREGAVDPLRHSAELVRGRWWRTLGYLFALGCIASLWDIALQVVLLVGGTPFLKNALYQFLCYFSDAFTIVGVALLFINRESQHLGWQAFGVEKTADLEGIE